MTARDIQAAVAEDAGLKVSDLTGPRHHRSLANARFVAIYLCRRLLDMSWPEIGRAFQRDHTTCIHGFRRVMIDRLLFERAITLRMRLEAPVTAPGQADPEEVMA